MRAACCEATVLRHEVIAEDIRLLTVLWPVSYTHLDGLVVDAHHLGRHAHGGAVGGQVLEHHAARADAGVVAEDVYKRQPQRAFPSHPLPSGSSSFRMKKMNRLSVFPAPKRLPPIQKPKRSGMKRCV